MQIEIEQINKSQLNLLNAQFFLKSTNESQKKIQTVFSSKCVLSKLNVKGYENMILQGIWHAPAGTWDSGGWQRAQAPRRIEVLESKN